VLKESWMLCAVSGAKRIELCSNLAEGGTTPSVGKSHSVIIYIFISSSRQPCKKKTHNKTMITTATTQETIIVIVRVAG